jgi:hypothetical protein
MVERLLGQRIDGIANRVESTEEGIQEIRRGMDGHVGDLWENIRQGQQEILKTLSEHTREDDKNMQQIYNQMLWRVPIWALTIMTVGASVIGAMATWILDHIK